MATSSVCSCLGNIQSRYKRLVNNVFPSNPSEGLVKSNMDKLIFYALQAPEKLDRIGDYMFQKINNYLYRKRIDYVYITMEAMDHILFACRSSSSSLNLFIESFLKMVSLLLETNEVGLQIRATDSFIKFANIDEDTASYHRRYEFFISRFSQLCYGNDKNPETERKIRLSGVQGLQGVVRKTVNDDLQANIWDKTHMSKIVPSLLFNIECNSEILLRRSSTDSVSKQEETPDPEDQANPAVLADICLRELITRASFNNIAAILDPLLRFMDERMLWSKNEFPLHIFKIIMYSIPNQYSYRAIELLFSHLDKHKNSDASMRASVVEMISASVGIATGGSIGPALLEVFNTLLKHLKISVDFMFDSADFEDNEPSSKHPELAVQNAIINAAGVFSSILADYQRVDVMLYIIMKIPLLNATKNRYSSEIEDDNVSPQEKLMHNDLFKCLLQVTKSHQIQRFPATFSTKMLDAVFTGLCVNNTDIRTYVQEFFMLLMDRHHNLEKVKNLSANLRSKGISFNLEPCSRQDSTFIANKRQTFFFHIYESCLLSTNTLNNMKMLTNIICLLLLEFQEADHVVESAGFVLALQDIARSHDKLSLMQAACIHSLTVVFFSVVSEVTCISEIKELCGEVIRCREDKYKWMMSPMLFYGDMESIHIESIPKEEKYYFNRKMVLDAFRNNNYDTKGIEMPYEPKCTVERSASLTSIPDNFPIQKYDSQMSIKSGSLYRASVSIIEQPVIKITYEDLKDALRRENTEKKDDVLNFQKTPFHELVSNNERISQEYERKINKALEAASRPNHGTRYQQEVQKNLFEIEFPPLFVY